jgi:hypothetical protein
MADKTPLLTHSELADLCGGVFGERVERITAPGGQSRQSIRIHLETRSVIATQRPNPGRAMLEWQILKALHRGGAPVPEVLAREGNIIFQEDLGSDRLSAAMQRADRQQRSAIAGRAVDSLFQIRRVARSGELEKFVPRLGATDIWVRAFVGGPAEVSAAFGFAPPQFDENAACANLNVPARVFVKWDARPGNAMVTASGDVRWFDWEHCGRRQGMEDFAWLMGDEFWPVEPGVMIPMIRQQLAQTGRMHFADRQIAYLQLYTVLHIVQRLRLILRRVVRTGWMDAARALKYDDVGVVPDLAQRLCLRGRTLAGSTPACASLEAWFEACSTKLKTMENGAGKSAGDTGNPA